MDHTRIVHVCSKERINSLFGVCENKFLTTSHLILPIFISKGIRFLVASFVRKSFRMDIVEMLSDMKVAVPLLKKRNRLGWLHT